MIPVLLYHGVSDDDSGPLGPYTLRPAVFAEHMAWIAGEGHTTLTVAALQSLLDAAAPLPPRPLLITFDDGLADVAVRALPHLERHGLTATVFVTSAGTWRRLPRALAGRRTLSADDLGGLAEAGLEIASHGHEHDQLDLLPGPRVDADLRRSKAVLEDAVGYAVTSFAYPHGYNRRRTRTAAGAAGFTSACAVRNLVSSVADDRWRRSRLMITSAQQRRDLPELLRNTPARRGPGRDPVLAAGWRAARLARTRGRPLVTVAPASPGTRTVSEQVGYQ